MLDNILEIIAEIKGEPVDKYGAEDNLITDIGLSSFEVIQLISAVEQTYDLRVRTRDLDRFTTPRSIVDYIREIKK